MALHILTVVLLAVPTTLLANRLLGLRRGWLTLAIAGAFGWLFGTIFAGSLGGWEEGSSEVLLSTILLSLILTMVFIVGLDLLAPRGSLARDEEAGLFVIPHPARDIKNSVSFLPRYWQLVTLARKNGVRRGGVRASPGKSIVDDASMAVALRKTVEQAGGMLIKLGQVASTRDDLLPPEVCEEFAKLQSGVPPAPREQMQHVLEMHLAGPINQTFAEFDWEPLAAGSIAHAYRASLMDGERVIVKIQRPGLDDMFDRDRRALLAAAKLLERRTPIGLSLSPVAMANEFSKGLAEELDFTIEATNAVSLRKATPEDSPVVIPRVHRELSGRLVLVQEELDGVSIQNHSALDAARVDRPELARVFMRVYFNHVFEAGVYHADPHPGNILALSDGHLGLIDLGAVGRLSPTQRNAMLAMLIGLATNDVERIRHAVEEVGDFHGDVSALELDRAIAGILSRHMAPGMRAGVATISELVGVLGEFRITLQPDLTLLIRALLSFEGSLRVIDPQFDIFSEARRAATDYLSPTMSSEGLKAAIAREAMTQFPRLRRLPGRIDAALDQLTTGRLEARVSFLRSEQDVRIVKSLVNRVVLGLLAAMLGVGSVLLLGVEAGPVFGNSVPLNEVLGYLGLISSGVLTLRVVGEIVREGLN